MIDADACVAGVGVSEIIPESINRVFWIELPDGIGPTLCKQFLISGPRLGKEESIFNPAFRLICIKLRRDHVEIPGQNDWRVVLYQPFCIFREAFEPSEFVVELGARCRVAVWKIEAPD